MSNACRHQPSVCVLVQECSSATRAARAGCVFTDGAAASAWAFSPSSFVTLSRSACDTPLMMNVPRLNFVPAGLERLLGDLDVGVLQLVAQRDQRVVGVVVDREQRCPCPITPLGALTSPFTSSIGTSSTFDVGHADGLHAEASGNVHPVSS